MAGAGGLAPPSTSLPRRHFGKPRQSKNLKKERERVEVLSCFARSRRQIKNPQSLQTGQGRLARRERGDLRVGRPYFPGRKSESVWSEAQEAHDPAVSPKAFFLCAAGGHVLRQQSSGGDTISTRSAAGASVAAQSRQPPTSARARNATRSPRWKISVSRAQSVRKPPESPAPVSLR